MAINYMKDFKMNSVEHYDSRGALKPARDEYVGELLVSTDNKMFFTANPRDQIDYFERKYKFLSGHNYQENNFLIILESPHRLEFDKSGEPIALMMGKTGCLFFDFFIFHLSKSAMKIKPGNYNVIVCNAVQYQTSCGLNPINRDIRNRNWLDIYYKFGGNYDLKERIFSIKPKYIINLCTGGKDPNGLRSQISKDLDSYPLIKGKHYTEGDHPSSWYIKHDDNHRYIF